MLFEKGHAVLALDHVPLSDSGRLTPPQAITSVSFKVFVAFRLPTLARDRLTFRVLGSRFRALVLGGWNMGEISAGNVSTTTLGNLMLNFFCIGKVLVICSNVTLAFTIRQLRILASCGGEGWKLSPLRHRVRGSQPHRFWISGNVLDGQRLTGPWR